MDDEWLLSVPRSALLKVRPGIIEDAIKRCRTEKQSARYSVTTGLSEWDFGVPIDLILDHMSLDDLNELLFEQEYRKTLGPLKRLLIWLAG